MLVPPDGRLKAKKIMNQNLGSHVRCWFPTMMLSALALAAMALGVVSTASADEKTGEEIYKATCLKCHGAQGEGAGEQKQPLVGDRSILELTKVISETMPEDKPGTCTGEDAKKVASYIHEAFYSPIAQARIKPPRIALSRLTNRQYQNSMADLIGSFRQRPENWGSENGLKAEYYSGRGFGRNERVIERVDPVVKFDFGTESPDKEKITEPRQFSIRWEGSLLAPETGEYEFVVKTEHAIRLWVNDNRTPLIDAWVKSGNDNVYRETIFLLAGRPYPIKLEFSKAKQGVDDSKTKKQPPSAPASIALEWKMPHRQDEIIPARLLSPVRSPEWFVVKTPFPPDDRSMGYERGNSVSKEWERATTDAAIETVSFITDRAKDFTGTNLDSADAAPKVKEFCIRFAERAFRHPLSDEQKQLVVEKQFSEGKPVTVSMQQSLLLTLKSPFFLYHDFQNRGDAYDVAARLALTMWDSIPDEQLSKAAASNQLQNHDQVRAQAERMLKDFRTTAKLRNFLVQWVRADQLRELSKDPALYPEFNPAIISDLRSSLDMLLDDVLNSEKADYRQLLLSQEVYLNGRLAKYYGVELPAEAGFEKVKLDNDQRAGVLTHPYLLAAFAYTGTSSPIHRGVFISRSILGRSLRPPPEAVSPLSPDLHADLTTRERVTLQTSANTCMGCHSMINPLGFTLENFDATGRFRKEEKGKSIDAQGSYLTREGQAISFAGPRQIAEFSANSEECHTAFTEQLFHNLVKQPIRAFGLEKSAELRKGFADKEFSIRQLMVQIATSVALDSDRP